MAEYSEKEFCHHCGMFRLESDVICCEWHARDLIDDFTDTIPTIEHKDQMVVKQSADGANQAIEWILERYRVK